MSTFSTNTPPVSSPAKSPRSSPVWKRPSDIMKLRRAKRRSSTSDTRPLKPHNQSPSPLAETDKDAVRQSMKRRNPFSCSPRKKLHIGHDGDEGGDFDDSDFMLFRMLKSADNDNKLQVNDKCEKDSPSSQFLIPASPTKPRKLRKTSSTRSTELPSPLKEPSSPEIFDGPEEAPLPSGKDRLPLDWSLKMKIRFVSSHPFSWSSPLKTTEEAAGLSAFVRTRQVDFSPDDVTSDHKTALQQCCMYWMHPNLPWLKLFPRMVTDNKIGKLVPLLQDEGVINMLHTDWTNSFTSAFQLLKAQHCPYFYMCTHLFTVLFRASAVCGLPQFNAIVTPTTRGFRESLRNEGIDFSMPLKPEEDITQGNLRQQAPAETSHSDKAACDDEDEEDIDQTDEGAQSWLESIGLDKKKFPELRPEKIKMQREGYKIIDNKPESTVYVESSSTQALFNYLLNCRSCFASSGVQYGIPPTILAPVAFKGSTLKSLKVKHGLLRLQPHKTNQKGYSMELEGPILPNTQVLICDLLKATQKGDYSATLGVQDSSTSFNLLHKNCDNESADLNDCGLTTFSKEYCQQKLELERIALREIVCKEDLFSWTTG
ncbi:protein downstream neighbor of son homolog [Lineus longissimus]|uniref:protein downstream neighbor of son homolog n=1 Tax=Lineus longissimus TaxID=88925 RepID=UPI00315D5C7F